MDTSADQCSASTKASCLAAQVKERNAHVLDEAVDYIEQTKVEIRHMSNEIRGLQKQIVALQNLVNCKVYPHT